MQLARSLPARIAPVLLWPLGAFTWAGLVWLASVNEPGNWLYDWHVHAAGARDLLEGTLYRVPLHSTVPLPIDTFNLPPLSAALAVPLLALPDELAGTIWVGGNLVAMAVACYLAADLLTRHAWHWGAVLFALYSVHPWRSAAFLGNINPFMLLLVVGFAYAYLRGRQRGAGLLLASAVAVKLWPLTLFVVVLRDRRWTTLRWAAGALAVQAVIFLVWLGPDVVPSMVASFQARATLGPRDYTIGVAALRDLWEWWPTWAGMAVAAFLLAIPAHRQTGIAFGILGGLALITNLWRHYLPFVVFAVLLLALDRLVEVVRLQPSLKRTIQTRQLRGPDPRAAHE